MSTAILHLPLRDIPAVIADSLRIALKAHGVELTEQIVVEASRNAAQSLVSIDLNEDNQ